MRTMLMAATLLLLPTVPLLAQEPAGKESPQARYDALVADFEKAMREWQAELRKKVQEAQARGEEAPATGSQPPTKEYIGRAQDLAEEYAGTDDAVPFLCFIALRASGERNAQQKAVRTLLADHPGSARIAELVRYLPRIGERALGGSEQLGQAYDAILAANKDKAVLAHAHFGRGQMRLQTATSDEERAEGKADLVKAGELGGAELKKSADAIVFELENLQVGCTAPDIAGEDTDGVAFKLSDYRGKVVMLDFWGFW